MIIAYIAGRGHGGFTWREPLLVLGVFAAAALVGYITHKVQEWIKRK